MFVVKWLKSSCGGNFIFHRQCVSPLTADLLYCYFNNITKVFQKKLSLLPFRGYSLQNFRGLVILVARPHCAASSCQTSCVSIALCSRRRPFHSPVSSLSPLTLSSSVTHWALSCLPSQYNTSQKPYCFDTFHPHEKNTTAVRNTWWDAVKCSSYWK